MVNPLLLKHPFLYCKRKWCKHRSKRGSFSIGLTKKNFKGFKFVFDSSLGPYIKKMYYGTFEFWVVESIKKYLKPSDVFLDVGANIGYITAMAASQVTTTGQVHSFEPVPKYFKQLSAIAKLNPKYNIVVNNFALGEQVENATLWVAKQANIGANSLLPNFVPKELLQETITVSVRRLDRYIEENNLQPTFIKIDVEGFEFSVLKGASYFFTNHQGALPLVLVEIAPHIYSSDEIRKLETFMFDFGYNSYCPLGCHRLDIKTLCKTTDVLFKQA